MSSTWWIGIVTKCQFKENTANKLAKVLFKLCAEVGFTPLSSTFTYYENYRFQTSANDFELEFKEKPSVSTLGSLIKKYGDKDGCTGFHFTVGDKGEGFDGDFRLSKTGEIIDIWLTFDDFVADDPENVEKILNLCGNIYSAINAFYAYLSSEDDPEAKEGVIHTSEFNKVLENYEKGVVNSFNMKSFCEEVKRKDGTF